jgi:hypothetical protein
VWPSWPYPGFNDEAIGTGVASWVHLVREQLSMAD